MAEIKGTPGKDIYTVKSGDVFNGQEGDDEITFEKGGAAQGDSGNDTFMVPKTFTSIWDAQVRYWSSGSPILVVSINENKSKD